MSTESDFGFNALIFDIYLERMKIHMKAKTRQFRRYIQCRMQNAEIILNVIASE